MNRILKIFATGNDQTDIARQYNTVERYDGFVVVETPEETAKEVSEKYLTEDITEQYNIDTGQKKINTVLAAPNLRPHALAVGGRSGDEERVLSKGEHHYLVQFVGPVKKHWFTGVKKAGGELREPYTDFTYVVRTDEKGLEKIAVLPYVRWTGHLPFEARIETQLYEKLSSQNEGVPHAPLPRTKLMQGVYTVEFFGPEDTLAAVAPIKKLGFEIIAEDAPGNVLVIREKQDHTLKPEQLDKLSQVHGIRKIRERALNRTSNNVAVGIMGTALTMADTNLALSGLGETIGVCDTGLDTGNLQSLNRDFENRVKWIKSYPISEEYNPFITNPSGDDGPADLDSGHGTHVAGSVLGDGANSADLDGVTAPIRGLSHKAHLVFQAIEQELKWKNPADLKRYGRYLLAGIPTNLRTIFQDAYRKGVRIHSNSWGGGKPGEYDEQCRQLDQFVWDKKDFCILVAAGNDGSDADADGSINFRSVTSPGTAKNCITVGACENLRPDFDTEKYGKWWPKDYPSEPFRSDPMADNPGQVAAFSSRGPTEDNRFKPDIVAPGTFILSTRSSMIANNNTAWSPFPESKSYFYMGGTSMATPLVAGAVGLIREFLRTRKHIAKPSAAMMKATLVAGATRLGEQGQELVVDNHQGFGRVNLDAILSPAAPATAIFQDIRQGLSTGGVNSQTIEVKSGDLPLRIVMAYTDFPGNTVINNLNLILTAPNGKKFVGNQPIGGQPVFDSKNNCEVIHVPEPLSGTWKIDVVGSNIPKGPQDFALVIIGDL